LYKVPGTTGRGRCRSARSNSVIPIPNKNALFVGSSKAP